jgi:transcriptional regulator with XRE-family HTH domain
MNFFYPNVIKFNQGGDLMSTEWKSIFHERINCLYQNAKDEDYTLTQEAYAARLGTTRNSLRGWLRGSGQPDADGFARISNVENVSVDWLVGKTNTKNPQQTIAAHRTDDSMDDLPEEALQSIEDFKKFVRAKYKKD